jgi:peptidyl-dipeptidase A
MRQSGSLLVVAVLFAACSSTAPAAKPVPLPVVDAAKFVVAAESTLAALNVEQQRDEWVQENFITYDTQILASNATAKQVAASVELAKEAAKFDNEADLPYDLRRKLDLIKLSVTNSGLSAAAPSDPAKTTEVTRIATALTAAYGSGKYCPKPAECMSIEDIAAVMETSRDPKRLLEVWRGWHEVAKPMRNDYGRFVELMHEGARELGYADTGVLWRAKYDMPPDAFAAEVDRLWNQVRPLYESLHCYVRWNLTKTYGPEVVPPGKPIPAHLLGNLWAQEWTNVYDLVAPQSPASEAPQNDAQGYDLTKVLESRSDIDAQGMVKIGEHFFTSLGFPPLPQTFWQRSLFTEPRDRDVVCHASAWDIDDNDDLRVKMCIRKTSDYFTTIHHELGHNFYQRAYNRQPFLYKNSANDGFHEAVGDTIALSITPDYLVKLGLIKSVPPPSADIPLLLRRALNKVAFLPFGIVIDSWRWGVFSGQIKPADYNKAWWALRLKYQGIAPPEPRGEEYFDPGAKYHVAANVSYTRYFLADILQFQFHRALCQAAGNSGPLNRCSIYDNKAAGARLTKMLSMGQSRPWPEALEAISGQREMDATAIIDYFAPLKTWLDGANVGRECGW